MNWIKVTPETMPHGMTPVMATVRNKFEDGSTSLVKNVVYVSEENMWGYEDGADCIVFLDDCMEVTHWMPYPDPAESDGLPK